MMLGKTLVISLEDIVQVSKLQINFSCGLWTVFAYIERVQYMAKSYLRVPLRFSLRNLREDEHLRGDKEQSRVLRTERITFISSFRDRFH